MVKNSILASLFVAFIGPAPEKEAPPVDSFELRGSAAQLDESCVRLTPDAPWSSGSVWASERLDLTKPFDLSMALSFGDRDELGADGIVFVLAPSPETGWRGEGLGYAGLRGSLGVELDTYENWRQGDPSADHLALVAHGYVGHRGGPVVELPNLEDGKRHPFRVSWSPSDDELTVYLDGEQRAAFPGVVVREVLGDDARVAWGLTAGTGRKSNAQDVCFTK